MKKLSILEILHDKKGSSLIFAVFLLVIFGFIGVTLITILSNESISSSEELLSTKAFYLAESSCEITIADNLTGTNELIYDENNKTSLTYNNFTIEIIREIKDNVTVYECMAYNDLVKRKIKVKIQN
ncbi:hypothetical protein [Deferribacter desulfuricans]|uniref:hypothetical protein n=1 Tax=Deferribacter desulfuricans TaxID=197162 RepID=UPI00030E57FC|nr:hypothetical protein [Deferribacter desulfuricans]